MRGWARTVWRMGKFFTILFEANGVKPDFNDTSRGWDAFLKLDIGMKYCLVDTMVVLPMHQGDADVLGVVKRELNNAVLVLPDSIIYEAAHKTVELEGNDGVLNFDDFVATLSGTLGSAGIKFKFVRLGVGIGSRAQKMLGKGEHTDLSITDYTLLQATMKRQDMDIMTDDKALINAINAKRGKNANGKIRHAMENYNKRRAAVAWAIRRSLGKSMSNDAHLKWNGRLTHTEFFIGKAKVASINHKDGNASVNLLGIVKTSDKKLLVRQHKLSMQMKEEFLKWKPGKGKGDSATGPAKKKDWHRENENDAGTGVLDETQRKRVARKLKNKNIDDLDF